MPSTGGRNIAVLERQISEIFVGGLSLADELLASSRVGHGHAARVINTAGSYPPRIASIRANAPGLRYEMHDGVDCLRRRRPDDLACRGFSRSSDIASGSEDADITHSNHWKESQHSVIFRQEDGELEIFK